MMTLPPEKIGDKGQRYEVRYRDVGEMVVAPKTLGWSSTREGARKMVKAWKKRPECLRVWFIDRRTGGKVG